MDIKEMTNEQLEKELERRRVEKLKAEYEQMYNIGSFVEDNYDVFRKIFVMLGNNEDSFPTRKQDCVDFTFDFNVHKVDISKFFNHNNRFAWEQ